MSELADESLVLFPRRISPHYFDIIVAACRNAGFSPRVLHEIGSVVSLAAGIGYAHWVAPDVPAERVAMLVVSVELLASFARAVLDNAEARS